MIKTTKPGRNGTVRVTFALPADEPHGAVSVVGDFNDWNPFAHPLRPRANGTRSAAVTVPVGSMLHFRYLAEGDLAVIQPLTAGMIRPARDDRQQRLDAGP